LSANGYYDAVTPFFQSILNFENMPLGSPQPHENLAIYNYPSGHMVYLDNASHSAMKADLAAFYERNRSHSLAVAARRTGEETERMSRSPYRRRFDRTPY
jgi:carboxypeptidase C (cathepsin A)